MLKSRGDERFIAIPVFTSRFFRHSCVFINAHKGIHQPQDLKGKLVGLPEYQITAVVWLRGILQDDYAVYPQDIQWRSGGEETPGRKEKISVTLPWIHPEVERTIAIFGEDWWPYGIEKNRKTLETFLRYHKEQGLSDRLMIIEDLFAFETLDEQFKI